MGNAINYLSALVRNRTSICSQECTGVCSGQRFAKEYGKCIDRNGNEQILQKIKIILDPDGFSLTGRNPSANDGIIPQAAGELGRVIKNTSIVDALTGEIPTRCSRVRLSCLEYQQKTSSWRNLSEYNW